MMIVIACPCAPLLPTWPISDDQVQASGRRRQVPEQKGERTVDRMGLDLVIVVKDQNYSVGEGSDM